MFILPCCAISSPGMLTLATYIHHLDPVITEIPGTPLALRWYGLAYVGGFVLGYYVLRLLSERRLFCVEPNKLGDFVTLICIFGVLLGGRLGEFFFYWLPEQGLSGFLNDPTWVIRVWEGGMASHGGIICVIITALWYARRHQLSAAQIIDGLAIVSPIGLFLGRVANFINGELYGRPAPADSLLSVKFPLEIFELQPQQQIQAIVSMEHAAGNSLKALAQPHEAFYDTFSRICRESEAAREALGQFLTPRYPSQLFEAIGEGLVIFITLITIRLMWKNAPAGLFAALFAFMYAAARITCECFKQPDAWVWHGITQGQLLSLVIVLLGIPFLISAIRNYQKQKNL